MRPETCSSVLYSVELMNNLFAKTSEVFKWAVLVLLCPPSCQLHKYSSNLLHVPGVLLLAAALQPSVRPCPLQQWQHDDLVCHGAGGRSARFAASYRSLRPPDNQTVLSSGWREKPDSGAVWAAAHWPQLEKRKKNSCQRILNLLDLGRGENRNIEQYYIVILV